MRSFVTSGVEFVALGLEVAELVVAMADLELQLADAPLVVQTQRLSSADEEGWPLGDGHLRGFAIALGSIARPADRVRVRVGLGFFLGSWPPGVMASLNS